MYKYRAKIVDVYDGDTLTAIVDLGFCISAKVKLRLDDIDTPELRGGTEETKAAARAARDRLRELVLGKTVTIRTDRKGKYGRWIATVWCGLQTVQSILLREGHAKPYEQ